MKADTGQLQEFLKLNDISAMVMSIASRSFSMENRVPFGFILDEMTTFKVRDFEELPSVLREYGAGVSAVYPVRRQAGETVQQTGQVVH